MVGTTISHYKITEKIAYRRCAVDFLYANGESPTLPSEHPLLKIRLGDI